MYSPTSANGSSMVCDRSDDMKWNVHFCKKIELFTENDFGTIFKRIKPKQGNSIQYCNAKVLGKVNKFEDWIWRIFGTNGDILRQKPTKTTFHLIAPRDPVYYSDAFPL